MPSVAEAAAMIRSGEMSSIELLDRCLRAIEASNPGLNAWSHIAAERAIDGARAVDAAVAAGRLDELGPLAGVPFGVKDLENCSGMPTTKGSRWYAGRPPVTVDDIHVGRLRAAGALPIGKTTSPEFGAWGYTASPALGVTGNPWDSSRTPGGSSGGTAAAVSSGMVPFGTASDGGGSIRTPATFTGLPGLKPTYGRIPTFGVTYLAQNAVVGSLATTVTDTALLLDVMAGPDSRDRTCLPAPGLRYVDAVDTLTVGGLRATWSPDLGFAVVDPEVQDICARAAAAFIDAASLTAVERPLRLTDYIRVYARIEGADQFVDVPDGWQDRLDELDPLVAPGWRSSMNVTLPKFARVEADRRRLVHEIAELFDDVDVLLTPATAIPAFAAAGPMPTEIAGRSVHGGMAVIFPMLANLCNLPSISLPAGRTAAGLPVGLLVTAPRFREDICLRLGRLWEQAHPWPRHAVTSAS
jgi:aspartyl-tRNA(Asn)/glutamyl-tRNA(Gln) amidotransferase subunit A